MLASLADMPVPKSTVDMARDLGHDAQHARDYGMHRAADSLTRRRAATEGRIILTMDLGFSREIAVTGIECPGLVLFRLGNVTAGQITGALRKVLTNLSEEDISGHILSIEPDRIRRRPLPVAR